MVMAQSYAPINDPANDTIPVIAYDGIPRTNIQTGAVELQQSLFPEYYQTNSALRDQQWVALNDSALIEFWHENGPFVLYTLAQLSGLEWLEGELDIYLVRYYYASGNGDPLIFPIGGIKVGGLTEALPTDIRMKLNVIYYLSQRMLAQSDRFEDDFTHSISRHPLMQPGAYRRDNLAMLLALVTCEKVIGLDSTFAAYQSAFWKQRHPGREVFEKYLLTDWVLTADKPLTQWLAAEPYSSPLVALTRPPRRTMNDADNPQIKYIENVPLKGVLGLSLRIDTDNKRVIDKIDSTRIAFACGLRAGDVIRSVDGARIRDIRDMVEKIMERYQKGGSTLQIVRDDEAMTVLIQPLDLGNDENRNDPWNPTDSLWTPPENLNPYAPGNN